MEMKNRTFCGYRLPWAIILRHNHAHLKLIVLKYMYYDFHLEYNSFSIHFIPQMSMVMKNDYSPGQPIAISVNMFTENIQDNLYYMITSSLKTLIIHLSKNSIHNSFLKIYDGPGQLSNIIF